MQETTQSPPTNILIELRNQLRQFAQERDWDQFHSPRNLATALSVEAAELLEPFQWLTEEQSNHLTSDQLAQVRDEMADVLLYLIRLADKTGIDLATAAAEKIARNAERYPVALSRGTSKKYTEL